MNGWLADLLRTAWALWYWNTRKTLYVLRGRRGHCPCHNPSDTGAPLATGCEAVALWRQPERFRRRVCPLLARNDRGFWVCRVGPEAVRPFWGRAAAQWGGVLLALALLGGGGTFATLRGIGYQVTPGQVFWPPRWREFQAARVGLFISRARVDFQAGRVREAIAALSTAHQLDPTNFELGLLLGQFYQAGAPDAADRLYAQLIQAHPDHRNDVARVWFRSLLARGRFKDVAELAQRQLAHEPGQEAAWEHALIFAARRLRDPTPLLAAAAAPGVPWAAREILRFEARVRQAAPDAARDLLLSAPLPADSAYARVQRTELLTEFGQPAEALRRLAHWRRELGGRDVVRLAFAAYAAAGHTADLEREVSLLLAPGKTVTPAELTLVAQHLIRHPQPALVPRLVEAADRLAPLPPEVALEIQLHLLCAVGGSGDLRRFATLRERTLTLGLVSHGSLERLQVFFAAPEFERRVETLLPVLQPFALDLTYALLDRYHR